MTDAQVRQWREQWKAVKRKLPAAEKAFKYLSKMERMLREILELNGENVSALEEAPEKPGENLLNLAPANGATSPKKPGGMRDVIREALQPPGTYLKPRDIITFVKAKGIELEGKSSLAVRVGNQIFRMKETGFLIRNEKGEYGLNPNRN